MKRNLTLLLVFLFLSIIVINVDAQTASASDDSGRVHTVVKGDTLWDLSEQYLGNPFLWPKLWQWNDYISNPHLIYPGNLIKLYPPEVRVRRPVKEAVEEAPAKMEEVVDVVESEAAAAVAEEKTFNFPELRASGFIDNEELKVAGKIVDAEDEKLMLSDGDILYVNLSETGGGSVGDLYTLFKLDREIIHPVTQKSLGRKIITLGYAEITGFSKDVAMARVTKSFHVISRGDLIMPKEDLPEDITVRPAAAALEGYIVSASEERSTFGERDIVYIDLGRNNGVEPGNAFIIYKEERTVKDKKEEKVYTLPSLTIGRLLVLYVKAETSVAIILNSVEEIRLGQRIKSELN